MVALLAALCFGAQPAARAGEGCDTPVVGHVNMHVFTSSYQSMSPPSNLAVTLCEEIGGSGSGAGYAVGGGILTIVADSNYSEQIREGGEGETTSLQSFLDLEDGDVMTFSVEPYLWIGATQSSFVPTIVSDVRPIGQFRAMILKNFGRDALEGWEWRFVPQVEFGEIDQNDDGTPDVRFSGGYD
jgi:hypothetical protein